MRHPRLSLLSLATVITCGASVLIGDAAVAQTPTVTPLPIHTPPPPVGTPVPSSTPEPTPTIVPVSPPPAPSIPPPPPPVGSPPQASPLPTIGPLPTFSPVGPPQPLPIGTATPPPVAALLGQSPSVATVVLPSGATATARNGGGVFQKVLIPANQPVAVTVQYGSVHVGEVVEVEAMDGGTVSVPSPLATTTNSTAASAQQPAYVYVTVAANGTCAFTFQPGSKPGIRRIRLHRVAPTGAIKTSGTVTSAVPVTAVNSTLQFWISDQSRLRNQPPAAEPQNMVVAPSQL